MSEVDWRFIAEFLASNDAVPVRQRLNSFNNRLEPVSEEHEVTAVRNVFLLDSEEHALEFLMAVIESGGDPPPVGRMSENITTLVEHLVSVMDQLSFAIIPIVFAEILGGSNYRIMESIVLKTIMRSGEVRYFDLSGRMYKNMFEFEKHNKPPFFGILVYYMPLGDGTVSVCRYKLVGRRKLLMIGFDFVLGMGNVIGSIGLLTAPKEMIPLFGLLTASMSLFIMARCLWSYSDLVRFGGFYAARDKFYNLVITVVNTISIYGISLPCCIRIVEQLSMFSSVVLGVFSMISFTWMMYSITSIKHFW